jgi:hypothetical protein
MIRFIYNLLWPLGLLFFLPGYLIKMFRRGNYREKFGQRLGGQCWGGDDCTETGQANSCFETGPALRPDNHNHDGIRLRKSKRA